LPAGSIPRWEGRAPGRFLYELQDLQTAAIADSIRFDEQALEKGALVVEFDWQLSDRVVSLRAMYPDSYPRTRPIVLLRGDPTSFPRRHCSPIDGTLCLLGRETRQWEIRLTLARLLQSQLADALNGTGDEDAQGEPAEYWWNGIGLANSYCLVDSSWNLAGSTSGTLTLRYKYHYQNGALEMRALVKQVRSREGIELCRWSGGLPHELEGPGPEIQIPWAYVDQVLLPTPPIPDQLAKLQELLPSGPKSVDFTSKTSGRLFAIFHRSELQHGVQGLGWLFPIYHGPSSAFRNLKAGQRPREQKINVLPTFRAGDQDLGARVPSVQLLRDKTIAVIGVGAVGAPVAAELARSGCRELRLVDHDLVEPGNSIRWPIGASAWGMRKAHALAVHLTREYPNAQVRAWSHAIGSFDNAEADKGDAALLAAVLDGVDIVVDGTAAYGVTTVLSDVCAELGISLISLYATPSLEGGGVVRYAPDSGCPTCLEIAHHEGAIDRPPGSFNETMLAQPPGCAERTFTGASYDLQELSLEAMRLLVDTLSSPAESEGSVVHTLSLVQGGRRAPPSWRVEELPKIPRCSCNSRR
jgi:hypothetical protein